jgi:hypothetical protein
MAGVAPHPRDIGDRDVLFLAHIRRGDGRLAGFSVSIPNQSYNNHYPRLVDLLCGDAQVSAQASGGAVLQTTWQFAQAAVAAPRPAVAV